MVAGSLLFTHVLWFVPLQELRERVMEELERRNVILDDHRAPRIVFGKLQVCGVRSVHAHVAGGSAFYA